METRQHDRTIRAYESADLGARPRALTATAVNEPGTLPTMPLSLQTVSASATLEVIKQLIEQSERLQWELISLTRGTAKGKPENLVVYRLRSDPTPLRPIALQAIDGDLSLREQETLLTAGEAAEKQLVCYGSVLIRGVEQNVAVFRGTRAGR